MGWLLGGLGVLLVGLLFLEWIREQRIFRSSQYRLDTEKVPEGEEVRLLLLSDLHGRCYGARNRKLLEAAKRMSPDLVLVAGDLVTGHRPGSYAVALELLRNLAERTPVFYAPGNHEQKLQAREYQGRGEDFSKAFKKAGVSYLENGSDTCEIRGIPFRVTGLELPLSRYRRKGRRPLTVEELEALIGRADPRVFQVLVAHHPGYAPAYDDWGGDLTVSGHLHGGMVRLPGIGGLLSPEPALLPAYSGGLYRLSKTTLVVSRGLGDHTLPLRLFNSCELVLIRLCARR